MNLPMAAGAGGARTTRLPPRSQQQRKLMWAAASTKGGVGGVPQSVGKEFAEADKGGKLPKRVKPKAKNPLKAS